MRSKVLTSVGSLSMIAFGIWHFFVPAAWNWDAYITPDATELVLAVRAINVFFSLCLVLIGIVNLIFIFTHQSRFVLLVVLGLSGILWAVRCVLQMVYPQGTVNPWLQYGMLSAFVLIFLCFAASFVVVLTDKTLRTVTV
jgi:hypothetical protein